MVTALIQSAASKGQYQASCAPYVAIEAMSVASHSEPQMVKKQIQIVMLLNTIMAFVTVAFIYVSTFLDSFKMQLSSVRPTDRCLED